MGGAKLIIGDEKSMVGQAVLGRCDRRLRQAFPAKADEVFGGMPLLFFGDFAQLPPIGDSTLYSTKAPKGACCALGLEGQTAYMSFTQSVTLSTIF